MKKAFVMALITVFIAGSTRVDAAAASGCSHANTRLQIRTETTFHHHEAEVNCMNGMCQIVACEVRREVDKAVEVCTHCGEELGTGDITAEREYHSVEHD